MRVAGFMSGSGSNIKKIVEHQKKLPGNIYEVVLIITDVEDETRCKAKQIASHYGINYLGYDILQFYRRMGHKNKKDLTIRPLYYKVLSDAIKDYNINLISLGGFMSIITSPLLDYYSGKIVNVHPADLSIMTDGKRKYTGDHSVRDAILAGEKHIRSSVHIVREKVDYGEILVMSKPIEVKLPEDIMLEELKKPENIKLLQRISDENQNRLKEFGDWAILPRAIEMIARGRFGIDKKGNVFVDGRIVKDGYKIED